MTPTIWEGSNGLRSKTLTLDLSSIPLDEEKQDIYIDSAENIYTLKTFLSAEPMGSADCLTSSPARTNTTIKSVIRKISLNSPGNSPKRASFYLKNESKLRFKNNLKLKKNSKFNTTTFKKQTSGPTILNKLIDIKDFLGEKTNSPICSNFFIAGLTEGKNEVKDQLDNLNSYCFHENFCSKLKGYRPSVVSSFPEDSLTDFPVNQTLLDLVFPSGIKFCFSDKNKQQLISTFSQQLTTEKGEKYNLIAFPLFLSYSREEVLSKFQIDPCKNLIDFDKSEDSELEEKLNLIEQIGYLDTFLVPYSIVFLSKMQDLTKIEALLKVIVKLIVNNYSKDDIFRAIKLITLETLLPVDSSKFNLYLPFLPNGLEISTLPSFKANLRLLFEHFTPKTIILVLNLLLLDQKLIFLGEEYGQISTIIDSFMFLLYPFEWEYTLIKNIPSNMIDFFSACVPFIVGVEMSIYQNIKEKLKEEDICFIIDIGNDEVVSSLSGKKVSKSTVSKHISLFPRNKRVQLEKELTEVEEYFDSNAKEERLAENKLVRKILGKFYASILRNYLDYSSMIDKKIIFDSANYLEAVEKEDKPFLEEFITSQVFSSLLNSNEQERTEFIQKHYSRYKSTKKGSNQGILSIFGKESGSSLYLSFSKLMNNSTNNSSSLESREAEPSALPVCSAFFSDVLIPINELIQERYKETFSLDDNKVFDSADIQIDCLILEKKVKEVNLHFSSPQKKQYVKRNSIDVLKSKSSFNQFVSKPSAFKLESESDFIFDFLSDILASREIKDSSIMRMEDLLLRTEERLIFSSNLFQVKFTQVTV